MNCLLSRPRLRLGALTLCLGLLAGCALSPPKPDVKQEAINAYRQAGYRMPTTAAVVTRPWIDATLTDGPISLTYHTPSDPNPRPVVIFLPGLGQSVFEDNRWVNLWASNGYAVIRLQALRDDANIWTSASARSGDFNRIALTRFTDTLMDERLAQLGRQLRLLPQAVLPADLAGMRLDWNRVVLAGADLGAYTLQALALASPQKQQALKLQLPFRPRGYLQISPYGHHSGARLNAPSDPDLSVLMISSQSDFDAYGIVRQIKLRHLAFDQLVTAKGYYLELNQADHGWLSGGPAPLATDAPAPPRPDERADARAAQRGRRGHDGIAPEDDVLAEPGKDPAKARAEQEKRISEWRYNRSEQLTQIGLAEVSVEQLSLAFLDAQLNQDARAQSWLDTRAQVWLKNGDQLKHR